MATLTDPQRKCLDEQGWLALPGLIAPKPLAAMRNRLEELLRCTPQDHAGTLIVSNLLGEPAFDAAWLQEPVLQAAEHLLGPDHRLLSVASRGLRPGHGQQALHADWGGQGEPGVWYACHAICALVDFTEQNGSTRILPGSHRAPWMMKGHRDPLKPHPAERRLIGKAGTIFIMNIHCLHSAVRNDSSQPRLAIFSHFSRRDSPLLALNPVADPPAELLARFAPPIQALLRESREPSPAR